MKTKTMLYRDRDTANTIDETIYTALTLDELFSQTKKIKVFDDVPYVVLGKTATTKMNSEGFLTRTTLDEYMFGSLGFTNAITATAIIAAANYGVNALFVGSKVTINIDRVTHLKQADFYHCSVCAYSVKGVQTIKICLTASYKDSTAEKKQLQHDRQYNRYRGYIPLDKTENDLPMRFCEHIYIGKYNAFGFNVE